MQWMDRTGWGRGVHCCGSKLWNELLSFSFSFVLCSIVSIVSTVSTKNLHSHSDPFVGSKKYTMSTFQKDQVAGYDVMLLAIHPCVDNRAAGAGGCTWPGLPRIRREMRKLWWCAANSSLRHSSSLFEVTTAPLISSWRVTALIITSSVSVLITSIIQFCLACKERIQIKPELDKNKTRVDTIIL